MKYSIKCLLKDFTGYFSKMDANFHQLSSIRRQIWSCWSIVAFSRQIWRLNLSENLPRKLKKLLDPFCFAYTFYLASVLHKGKWVQLNGKTLQVLKNSLAKTAQRSRAVRIFLVKTQSVILDSANLKKFRRVYLIHLQVIRRILSISCLITCN